MVWIARKLTILANLYGSNAPKGLALAHSLEQAPGLSLADTLSLHYAMRNELALSPVDFLLRRTNHMLFMRDSLIASLEPVLDEMGRFYDWTEEEKAAYHADVEAALAQKRFSRTKKLRKLEEREAKQHSCARPFF